MHTPLDVLVMLIVNGPLALIQPAFDVFGVNEHIERIPLHEARMIIAIAIAIAIICSLAHASLLRVQKHETVHWTMFGYPLVSLRKPGLYLVPPFVQITKRTYRAKITLENRYFWSKDNKQFRISLHLNVLWSISDYDTISSLPDITAEIHRLCRDATRCIPAGKMTADEILTNLTDPRLAIRRAEITLSSC